MRTEGNSFEMFNFSKIFAIVFLVIIFSTSCASIISTSKYSITEADLFLEEANNLYKLGRYHEAIIYAKHSLDIREGILGKDHLDLATNLNNLAELYRKTGMYGDAESLLNKSLKITERILGRDHPDVAISLNNLALLYQNTGQYLKAESLYRESLTIIEKVFGKSHSDIATIGSNLAELYRITGRYAEAEGLFKRSLEISERVLGRDHPDIATGLNNLAVFYYTIGRYADVESLLNRSLEITEKILGRNHPDVAITLNNLGDFYRTTGRYGEAESLLKRSLNISEIVLGRDHPDVAISLNNLARLYKSMGRYTEAESLFKRALEINKKLLGEDNINMVISLDSLAQFYKAIGRYAEAELLFRKSLGIREKVFGPDHHDVATNLSNLAGLYQTTGRYFEAERLYKRSLDIMEKVLGKDHLDVATSTNNLAWFYYITGRYAEAHTLYNESLKITEKVLGDDHADVAGILNNLARLYYTTGQYADAEYLLKKSLEIRERVFGQDHSVVAENLNDLAVLYFTLGRNVEVEQIYLRSIKKLESLLGKEHPHVATTLNNLASLYQALGKDTESESLYKRSLEIKERALGKDHPEVGIILNNLASLYAVTRRHLDSHKMFNLGIQIEGKKREDIFLFLSERQKLDYMHQNQRKINRFISHTVLYTQTDLSMIIETLDAWLGWKGAVMEAQGRYIDAITYSEDSEVRKKFDELNNLRREIAKVQLSKPEEVSLEGYRKRIEELEKKKESLEAELSRMSKDYALEKMAGRADVNRVSEILLKKGNDSVYIDFANIHLYDFKENKFGKPRYFVFILLPDKEPVVKLIDLSNAEGVDQHINAYLDEMKRAKEYGEVPRERILKAEAKALYKLLLKPIEKEIKGKTHLYISPDGNLNLIPFEVLMTPEGKYLMEDYTITYVGAGRDIMRFMDDTVAKGDGLIIADPDYDMGLDEKNRVARVMGVIETRGPAPLTRDAKDMRFKRLPDTKIEAEAIEKCLRESQKINVRSYQDKNALEEILLATKNPRILHLATHGYFLKDEEVKRDPQMMGFISPERDRFVDIGIENPMLRSGIVLAGANASLKEGRDDGVVSAEKILGLRLKGTDLVVLSACDTGVGDVKSGEGVFGLKRSFILSGAKTVVMSLWNIPSKETTEMMTEFYTLMAKGKTKAEAFREARLNLMKKKPNPFYWGAFIMVGNPN